MYLGHNENHGAKLLMLQILFLHFFAAGDKRKFPFEKIDDNAKYSPGKKNNSSGRQHQKFLPSVCVDLVNGIFMVTNTMTGVAAPIRVVNHKMKKVQACSNQTCSDFMANLRAGNPAVECFHLRSSTYSIIASLIFLDKTKLLELSEEHLLTEKTVEKCLGCLKSAEDDLVPLVVQADFSSFGYNDRMMYFSVYTGKTDYFCLFKRVRVSFDSEAGAWACKYPSSTERKDCIHASMCKWYLFQMQPEKLQKFSR